MLLQKPQSEEALQHLPADPSGSVRPKQPSLPPVQPSPPEVPSQDTECQLPEDASTRESHSLPGSSHKRVSWKQT